MVYIGSANKDLIFDAVRAMYTDVALHPDRGYHFPTGRAACTFVSQTGGFAAIGSIDDTGALLRGEAGTVVALDAAGLELSTVR